MRSGQLIFLPVSLITGVGISSAAASFDELLDEPPPKSNGACDTDNPSSNGKFRPGVIYFKRDKEKSIFNFLWKSTFSGLKSTMGINTDKQKEIKKAGTRKK